MLIKNVTKLAKFVLTDPSAMDRILNSRLFTCYRCSENTDSFTYTKLMDYLSHSKLLSGNLEIRDAKDHVGSYLVRGASLSYTRVMDIPVIVNIQREGGEKEQHNVAYIYILFKDRNKWESNLTKIFPYIPTPMHFHLSDSVRDWMYDHGIRTRSLLGPIPREFGTDKPIMEPATFKRLNLVFNRYINEPEWYSTRNRPRKEVVMLYGPPGTGKTSVLRYFIREYKTHLIEYNPAIGTQYLLKLIASLRGEPVVVLIEDIDSYGALTIPQGDVEPSRMAAQETNKVYSEFLNLLDGLKPLNNCLVVFTTNYPEKLKKPIYRMGRVNHLIEMGYPTLETIRNFLGFSEDETRWKYIAGLEDYRLPLDAIYRIRETANVPEIEAVIKARDLSLTLSDKKSYD